MSAFGGKADIIVGKADIAPARGALLMALGTSMADTEPEGFTSIYETEDFFV